MELYYRRSESTHKGRQYPARVETVVLFLPDVWSCLPTRLEWDGLQRGYRGALEEKLMPGQASDAVDGEAQEDEAAGGGGVVPVSSDEKAHSHALCLCAVTGACVFGWGVSSSPSLVFNS